MLLDKNEKEIKEPNCETNEEGHLGSIEIDGKQVKIVNTATVVEILAHRLENGREVTQVVAHEFMMVEHKAYMVRLLTDAINTVMKANNKKASLVKAVSAVVAQKLGIKIWGNREQRRAK